MTEDNIVIPYPTKPNGSLFGRDKQLIWLILNNMTKLNNETSKNTNAT